MPQSVSESRLPHSRNFDLIKDSMLQSGELPLADVLDSNQWQEVFEAHKIDFGKDEGAIYTPAITLWALISQVFFKGEMRSCKAAVERIASLWAAFGKGICSTNTGAYCRARAKITWQAVRDICCQLAQATEQMYDAQEIDVELQQHDLVADTQSVTTRGRILLVDGFTVTAMIALVLVVAAFSQFAETRRVERVARERFAQYLPQAVVDRYLDQPGKAPIAGEEREVTALFTDIEGFSALAGRVRPQELVALLNIYFAEVNKLVADHGGMVDKVVGDAVHAFFNAPEDLDDHINKAIDCALAISRLTEEMRNRPQFKAQDFGRTRIGIETGMAVLGEVGLSGKLDYTAHGNSINLAARLQDANKFLGSTICVGPAANRNSHRTLRALGEHEIRGFGTMALFTPDDYVGR